MATIIRSSADTANINDEISAQVDCAMNTNRDNFNSNNIKGNNTGKLSTAISVALLPALAAMADIMVSTKEKPNAPTNTTAANKGQLATALPIISVKTTTQMAVSNSISIPL